jgi:hypothetical protein
VAGVGLLGVPPPFVEPVGHGVKDVVRLAEGVPQGGAGVAQVDRGTDQCVDGDTDDRAEDGLGDTGRGGGDADPPPVRTNRAPVAA